MAIDRQKIAKYYSVGSSLILLILGVGVVGPGVWIAVEGHLLLDGRFHFRDDTFTKAGLCLVASGSLSLVVACLGCCVTYTRNKWLIVSYICFCAIVYAGQLIGGTINIVKVFDEGHSNLEEEFRRIKPFHTNLPTFESEHKCCGIYNYTDYNFRVVNFLLLGHKCCGIYNYTDYNFKVVNFLPQGVFVPDWCCSGNNRTACQLEASDPTKVDAPSSVLYTTGCRKRYKEWMTNVLIVMTVWLGLGVLYVVGIALVWRLHWKAKANGYSDISD